MEQACVTDDLGDDGDQPGETDRDDRDGKPCRAAGPIEVGRYRRGHVVADSDDVETAAEWPRRREPDLAAGQDVVDGVRQVVARDSLGESRVVEPALVPEAARPIEDERVERAGGAV